jgi:hypothetical protein
VISLSVVDCGIKPERGQTKNWKTGICCFSTKHVVLRSKSRLIGSESRGCVRVGRHVSSEDYCVSELAVQKSSKACWSKTKQTSSSSYRNVTCSLHDTAEKVAHLALNNNHSVNRKSTEALNNNHSVNRKSTEALNNNHSVNRKSTEALNNNHSVNRKSTEALNNNHSVNRKSTEALNNNHSVNRKSTENLCKMNIIVY